MLVFNQQANIKNVNGAIADTFANRPAPQSTFYVFYSIDTQEIYYDNGAWVLIGSSAGGGANIYNTNGTLTGNRTLNGANKSLNFSDLGYFEINGDNTQSLVLDWANYQFALGDINYNNNGTFFKIDDNNQFAYTENNNQIKGFYFNYGLNRYFYGDTTGGNNVYLEIWNNPKTFQTIYSGSTEGIYLNFNTGVYQLGQITSGNQIHFNVDDNIQVLSTYKGGNRLGLEFDYTVNIFKIGDVNTVGNFNVLSIEDGNNQIFLGKPGNINLNIDNTNNIYKTVYNGNDIGLKLDFANTIYQFGQITGGNQTHLKIDDTQNRIEGFGSGLINGIRLDFGGSYIFGELQSTTPHYIEFQGANVGNNIKTFVGNQNIGLNIDYAVNGIVELKGVQQSIILNENLSIASGLGNSVDYTNQMYSVCNNFILADANNANIKIGDNQNFYYNELDITNQFYKFVWNGNDIGLKLDFANTIYQFGQLTGGNTTYLTINDSATYPVQIDGTNVLSGSSGSTSGQHLKIKINGVDYKIELKNP